MITGRICYWNPEKGYGFIRPDDYGARSDVFVHAVALDETIPTVGDAIEFEVQLEDRTGRMRAVNARIIA
jgi:CspA family cold shock protein